MICTLLLLIGAANPSPYDDDVYTGAATTAEIPAELSRIR
jgi:hypothetical protein